MKDLPTFTKLLNLHPIRSTELSVPKHYFVAFGDVFAAKRIGNIFFLALTQFKYNGYGLLGCGCSNCFYIKQVVRACAI